MKKHPPLRTVQLKAEIYYFIEHNLYTKMVQEKLASGSKIRLQSGANLMEFWPAYLYQFTITKIKIRMSNLLKQQRKLVYLWITVAWVNNETISGLLFVMMAVFKPRVLLGCSWLFIDVPPPPVTHADTLGNTLKYKLDTFRYYFYTRRKICST